MRWHTHRDERIFAGAVSQQVYKIYKFIYARAPHLLDRSRYNQNIRMAAFQFSLIK